MANKQPSFINQETKEDRIKQIERFVNKDFGPRKETEKKESVIENNRATVQEELIRLVEESNLKSEFQTKKD